jgi:hypothetical protein
MKTIEQHGKGVPIALLNGVHDFLVAEVLKLRILGLRATPR